MRHSRALFRCFLVCCVLAVLAGLAVAPAAHAVPVAVGSAGVVLSWGIDPRHPLPTERGGPARSGTLAHGVMLAAPAVAWEVTPTAAHPRGPIVASDGTTYLGTSVGLLAIGADGSIVFDAPIAPVDAPPALLPGGSVVVATRDRDVVVVGRGGSTLYRVSLGSAARASPLVLADGSIVLSLLDRTLVRLRADLEPVFAVELRGGALSAPTLAASGRLVVTSGDLLYVLEPEAGAIVRAIPLSGRAIGPVARRSDGALVVLVAEGEVLVITGESEITARHPLGGRLYAGGALALAPDGGMVVAIPSRGIVSLAPDGTERWTFSTDAPFYGVVTLDRDGRAIAIDRRGRLTVLDPAGALLWRMELAALEAGGVALDGERLIVATDRPSVLSLVPAP